MRTIAAILAGGLARRLGGGDKSLRLVAGRPILDHIVERLRPQCGHVLLNANGDPDRFAGYGLTIVPDDVPGHAGPLAGLLAVLDHLRLQCPDASELLTVPGDTPFLPRDLVRRLSQARATEATISCAASGGRRHPVIGLWPVSIREDLRDAVQRGDLSIGRFAARYPLALVEWEGPDPFLNVNTAEDLREAELRAEPPP